MACSVSHTENEIQALVQKLIDEDMVRQKAIMDLALQFDNACTAKDDHRKAYEKCNDIPQESRALIDTFLKEGSDKDYELNLSIPVAKLKDCPWAEGKLGYLEQPLSPTPEPATASEVEDFTVYEMLRELKTMFHQEADQELFETVKAFHACTREEWQSVSLYVLKMKSYLDKLKHVSYPMPKELGVSLILNSLSLSNMIRGKIQKNNNKNKPQAVAKGNGRGKGKQAYALKPKIHQPPKKKHPAKNSICHHYNECLWGSRKLKHEALNMYMGTGMRATVEAIRSFDIILPSGLTIVLDNCHFAHIITRGVVSLSRFVDNGLIYTFNDYGISVSKDNVVYFNDIPRDGIYEIDMHDLVPNVSSIYNVSNKRVKRNLDSTYLWHYHSAQPFPHQAERAKDLLGPIHTDVCGPFRTVLREGDGYVITFTNDFDRYGYVYLIKHKHEVFETFKAFRNEVENQLGKTIKALRYDRGREYMSHEFLDHLKSRGIVSQLTSPRTLQHNGVFERRNQKLLDMVQSMMNLTTLPMSFWDML
ncbi:retrotransposon protein, putative, ty1-copia subclass [Tanacetum coccineum]